MYRQSDLERYAELLVRFGGNLQEGQLLVLFSGVETCEFANLVSEAAFKAGARDVRRYYDDEAAERLRYQYASVEALTDIPDWRVDFWVSQAKQGACFMWLESDNPTAFAGLDPTKIGAARQAWLHARKEFNDITDRGEIQWSIAAVPAVGWAKQLFPELTDQAAVEKLWDVILDIMKMDQPDPVAAWQAQSDAIRQRCHRLNQSGIVEFRMTNSLGTDLTVGMAEGYQFKGGASVTSGTGVAYQANLPTEEVFSMPHRDKVNGTVVSALPLNYQGMLIDRFRLTFRDGAVVDFSAETGEEALQVMLDIDAGSRYLGEIAFVPYTSAIRRSGILFYNILFDENASCHLALGSAYPETMSGWQALSETERRERGYNESVSHVDFMFGTEDLLVVGRTADGREITVMENGVFVGEDPATDDKA